MIDLDVFTTGNGKANGTWNGECDCDSLNLFGFWLLFMSGVHVAVAVPVAISGLVRVRVRVLALARESVLDSPLLGAVLSIVLGCSNLLDPEADRE